MQMAQFFTVLKVAIIVSCSWLSSGDPVTRKKRDVGDSVNCEFGKKDDLSFCEWVPTNLSECRWQGGVSDTANWLGGPKEDHTTGVGGGYAFVDTSTSLSSTSMLSRQIARLESPLLEPTTPQGTCIRFWYNIQGLSPESLRLYLVPDDLCLPMGQFRLWEERDSTVSMDNLNSDETSDWKSAQILYTCTCKHKLAFEAQSKSSSDPLSIYRGSIAIDDIDASSHGVGAQSCPGFCSFEGGLCDWTNDKDNSEFDWQESRGSNSHLTGPARDHGSQVHGGSAGGYIYIDTSSPRRPGDRARLISSLLDPTTGSNPLCIRFYTHMYGSGVGSLKILISGTKETLIWMVSGDAGNQWHMGQATISSSAPFQVIFQGTVGRNPIGNIAIDDITFHPGPCPAMPPTAIIRQADCTFETDECSWINVNRPDQDQIDWQRVSPLQMSGGQTNLPIIVRRMEPTTDHTTGLPEGYYLQMEKSNTPSRNGDRAMFVSPTFKPTSEGCLSFWVAMHERTIDSAGPGLGTLRVYIRPTNALVIGPVGIPRWRLSNFEASSWFFAQVPLRYEESAFKVIIEGTWGFARQGTMAIDDISIYDDISCKVIPSIAEVSIGECSFDRDLCEWKVAQNNITSLQNQWQVATPLRKPNNINDHTYLTPVGYAFFDVYNPSSPVSVRLESPELPPPSPEAKEKCISFWILSLGSTPETELKVIVGESDNGQLQEETELWSISMSELSGMRSEWIYAQTSITMPGYSKVIFEGTSSNGGFAIDDINVYDGECPSRPLKARRHDSGKKVRTDAPQTQEPTLPVDTATTSSSTEPTTQFDSNTSTNEDIDSGP